MARTPEGRYFATSLVEGKIAPGHASMIALRNEMKSTPGPWQELECVQSDYIDPLPEQLANLGLVLLEEVYFEVFNQGEGINIPSLIRASTEYAQSHDFRGDASPFYVALKVIGDEMDMYIGAADAGGPDILMGRCKRASHLFKKDDVKVEPTTIREGIIFLREHLEGLLSPEEREKAHSTLYL